MGNGTWYFCSRARQHHHERVLYPRLYLTCILLFPVFRPAISLNALMMAAFVLMGGKLADILGMKRTFLLGATLYVCGSLLASLVII